MADASKIMMVEGDAPVTPGSGQVALYCKTDHIYYSKGSDGVERSIVGTPGATGPAGPAGADGADGADGDSAYCYIAYASDASGTGFSTTFNAALDYIAIKSTSTEIATPQASDFAGLWKNYKGATGATGATGPAGLDGADGADGVGVPTGGTTGQVLTKNSNTNYDTAWSSPGSSYTDENAQDAVGGILVDSTSIDFTYTDATPSITAAVLPAGVDHDSLLNFVANEHIDWTADQGATNIHSGNIPDLSGTYATTGHTHDIDALLPSQTSNSGKFLTTDGTDASWGSVSGYATTADVIALAIALGG